jgi:hypothetical protein
MSDMSESFEITDYHTLASGRNIVIPLDERKTGVFDAHLVLPHAGPRAWVTTPGWNGSSSFITETQIRRMAAALADYVEYLDRKAAGS